MSDTQLIVGYQQKLKYYQAWEIGQFAAYDTVTMAIKYDMFSLYWL